MKFLKTYVMCLVVSEVFLVCGGWMLFDFQRRPFLTFAVVALVLAVLISAWASQENRIDELEKRVRDLGEQLWSLENRTGDKSGESGG